MCTMIVTILLRQDLTEALHFANRLLNNRIVIVISIIAPFSSSYGCTLEFTFMWNMSGYVLAKNWRKIDFFFLISFTKVMI